MTSTSAGTRRDRLAAAAAVAAATTLVLVWQRSRAEVGEEERARSRRVRVPVGPVADMSPTTLGVDSAVQRILPGGEVPDHQGRAIDHDLRRSSTRASSAKTSPGPDGTGGAAGAAVVEAAAFWSVCGRTDPAPRTARGMLVTLGAGPGPR